MVFRALSRFTCLTALAGAAVLAAGCGGSATAADPGGAVADDAGASPEAAPDDDAAPDAGDEADDAAPTEDAPEPDATDDASPPVARDPAADGPFAYKALDAMPTLTTGGATAIHCEHPTDASSGPYPLVLIVHGFQLPTTQYYGYAQRLASFGYVACTSEFPSSFLGNDNPTQAATLSAAIDWLVGQSVASGNELSYLIDVDKIGITGHSLGGKLSVIVASQDARIRAMIVLDPVDGGGPTGCNAPQCVDSSSLTAGLSIPTAFLGETTDGSGTFQACAPTADNYDTFYAGAKAPSLQVTVLGANHMSFLDSPSTCGLTCSFCNKATAPDAQVHALALSYVTAFYERRLRGNAAYDDYLTGSTAQSRYVATGQAMLDAR